MGIIVKFETLKYYKILIQKSYENATDIWLIYDSNVDHFHLHVSMSFCMHKYAYELSVFYFNIKFVNIQMIKT